MGINRYLVVLEYLVNALTLHLEENKEQCDSFLIRAKFNLCDIVGKLIVDIDGHEPQKTWILHAQKELSTIIQSYGQNSSITVLNQINVFIADLLCEANGFGAFKAFKALTEANKEIADAFCNINDEAIMKEKMYSSLQIISKPMTNAKIAGNGEDMKQVYFCLDNALLEKDMLLKRDILCKMIFYVSRHLHNSYVKRAPAWMIRANLLVAIAMFNNFVQADDMFEVNRIVANEMVNKNTSAKHQGYLVKLNSGIAHALGEVNTLQSYKKMANWLVMMSGFLMEEKNLTKSVTPVPPKPKERKSNMTLPTDKLNKRFPLLPSAKSIFASGNSEDTGNMVSCGMDTFTDGNMDIAESVASSTTTNTSI